MVAWVVSEMGQNSDHAKLLLTVKMQQEVGSAAATAGAVIVEGQLGGDVQGTQKLLSSDLNEQGGNFNDQVIGSND